MSEVRDFKEPWHHGYGQILGSDGNPVLQYDAHPQDVSVIERVILCVNAFAGVPDKAIKATVDFQQVQQNMAELLREFGWGITEPEPLQ